MDLFKDQRLPDVTNLGTDIAKSAHVSKAASEAQSVFRPTVRMKAMLRNLLELMETAPSGSDEVRC